MHNPSAVCFNLQPPPGNHHNISHLRLLAKADTSPGSFNTLSLLKAVWQPRAIDSLCLLFQRYLSQLLGPLQTLPNKERSGQDLRHRLGRQRKPEKHKERNRYVWVCIKTAAVQKIHYLEKWGKEYFLEQTNALIFKTKRTKTAQ